MAQGRFERFTPKHQVHLVLEGQMNRMGQDGEKELDQLLFDYKPNLVIVDILAKLKLYKQKIDLKSMSRGGYNKQSSIVYQVPKSLEFLDEEDEKRKCNAYKEELVAF